ncbi:MAG: CpaF family protein [Armatimonadota bacterium]
MGMRSVAQAPTHAPARQPSPAEHEREQVLELKASVHAKLLEETEFAVLERLGPQQLAAEVRRLVGLVASQAGLGLSRRAQDQAEAEVLDEVVGYGPIQPLLDDPEITEVMVNGAHEVYVERHGRIEKTTRRFLNDAHLMRIIHKIVTPLGRRIDESSPMVDARLPDGSRVNAIIPPLAVRGPTLTVRKFSRDPYTPDNLVDFGTMSPDMRDFLQACVVGKLNIIISGGTGSGKTTTLNAASSFIPHAERIVTIEDAAELQLQQPHVVPLESRPPNLEGQGEITIRQLVRNALRMRPDRIIVGEVRGAEALDMLQALNTGHQGSLSTVHANSPRDTLSRLETMVLMAGTELPSRAIREQITAAIDLIVHQARLRDGSRKIIQVTEVQRMEGDVITLQDLFVYRQEGAGGQAAATGAHVATGLRPLFYERLVSRGVEPSPPASATAARGN